jgi:hypothetical protein
MFQFPDSVEWVDGVERFKHKDNNELTHVRIESCPYPFVPWTWCVNSSASPLREACPQWEHKNNFQEQLSSTFLSL